MRKTIKEEKKGYSLFTHWWFDNAKNEHNYFGGKDCMKKISKEWKEQANIYIYIYIYVKKKLSLSNNLESYQSYHK